MVSYIIGNVSAVPVPSMCDLIIFRNTGDESQLAEFLTRPAQLPQLPAMTSEAAARLQREADLAKSLRLPRPKLKSEVIEAAQRSPRLSQDATTLSLALKAGGGDPQVAATTSAGGAADTNKIKTAADEAQAAAKAKADAACKANNAFHNDDAHLLEEVTSYQASPEQRKQWGLEAYGSPESLGLPVTGKAALINPDAMLAVRNLNHDHLMMALKRTFERYNLWEKGVNKVRIVCGCGCVAGVSSIRCHQQRRPSRARRCRAPWTRTSSTSACGTRGSSASTGRSTAQPPTTSLCTCCPSPRWALARSGNVCSVRAALTVRDRCPIDSPAWPYRNPHAAGARQLCRVHRGAAARGHLHAPQPQRDHGEDRHGARTAAERVVDLQGHSS